MGIDIHIHDHYLIVGHIPLAVGGVVLALASLLGVWKLASFLWR